MLQMLVLEVCLSMRFLHDADAGTRSVLMSRIPM